MTAGAAQQRIVIPKSVTIIDEEAFDNCKGLTGRLMLHEGLTELGKGAFEGCSSLTSLITPSTLKTIPEEAFCGCAGLKEIEILNVRSIGKNAFNSCTGLTSLDLSQVEELQFRAFYGCTGLKNLIVPAFIDYNSNFYSAGNYFENCTGLTHIRLTGIGEMASQYHGIDYAPWTIGSGAGNEVIVEIDEGITSIGVRGFYYCENLAKIIVPRSVQSVNEDAFNGCSKLMIYGYRDSYIQSYAEIMGYPFVNMEKLDPDFILPASIDQIEDEAFFGCNFRAVLIPEGCTSIGALAFAQCPALEQITLPTSVTKIAKDAFDGCNLVVIFCDSDSVAERFAVEQKLPFIAK